ncbi:hypothetical protein BGZ76_004279 [Entomortierella beljakovae]|nr:hypothetical protein BGZ76_004279 [Entomortierella beljakovae]
MDFTASLFRFDNDYERQQYPSYTDNINAREFERAFCRDFHCCGLRLVDLHDLLQHYEECHVRFEDEDDIEQGENESDYFDEESWSDSDSAPSSPSSGSPSGSAYGRIGGSAASELTAAVAQLFPSLPPHYPQPLGPRTESSLQYPVIHSTHPLYRHPSNTGSSSNDANFSIHNPSTQTIDSIVADFNHSVKRKSVALVDIYSGENIDITGDNSSSSSSFSGTGFTKFSRLDSLNPVIKRVAIDPMQRSTPTSVFSEMQLPGSLERKLEGPCPTSLSAGNNAKLLGVHQEISNHPSVYPSVLGPIRPTGHTYFTPAVNVMQRKEEVYSLMEDLSKSGNGITTDKPYRCTVLGCDKSYKNPNGLKYHNIHGHCSATGMCDTDSPESRPYVCTFLDCGKRYKNLNGLKYHIEHSHPNLTAALRAHQSGLINPDIFGPYPSQAAMTIAAALQSVNSSPMMMAAANAILTAQAVNAAAAASTGSMPNTVVSLQQQHCPVPILNQSHPLDSVQGQKMESFFPPDLVHKQIPVAAVVGLGPTPIQ